MSDKPLFIEAFIFTKFFIPSFVRCSPLLINSTADLKSIKSACFCVIKGLLSKKGIIIFNRSSTELT